MLLGFAKAAGVDVLGGWETFFKKEIAGKELKLDTVSIVLLLTITLLLFAILLGPRKESYTARPQMPSWLVWVIRLAMVLAVGRILVYLLSRYGFI